MAYKNKLNFSVVSQKWRIEIFQKEESLKVRGYE